MWNLFRFTSFFWMLSSAYLWITSLIPLTPMLILINVVMIVSLSFLPIKIELGRKEGMVMLAILGLVIWSVCIDGPVMGLITFMQYFPVMYLLQLPDEYKRDLLRFSTKWYAIALAGGLVIYALSFVMTVPSIGKFVHPVYFPYTNHVLWIRTTFDYGIFERFNAFFLEPGHQALVSSFLMMANKYDFKKNPYLLILLIGVIFSFSLAGYLLTAIGFLLMKINSVVKLIATLVVASGFIIAAQNWNGGDNPVNELIIGRLEYDESKGIKGNNRFYNNTDDDFNKAVETGGVWIGIKNNTNMSLVGGAGYKIYIINYGIVGVLLVLLFYLSLIPSKPDIRYTLSFFIVLTLCFIQRSYPFWYVWYFSFVTGIYLAKDDKNKKKALNLQLLNLAKYNKS